MPMYDLACDSCQILYEDVFLSVSERDRQVCDECSGALRTVIAPVPNIGANWSKPIKVGFETFHTNAEFRKANREAESEGYGLVSKGDTKFRTMWDRLSDKRERTAKAQGFRHDGHRQEVWRKRRLEGKQP